MLNQNIAAEGSERNGARLGDVLLSKLTNATNPGASGGRIQTSPLALEIDALVAGGFGDYLRPCPPPGTGVWLSEKERFVEKISDGKLPARFSDGRWFGITGWPKPRTLTAEDLRSWRTWPHAGLCLVTGDVVAIDVDIKVDPTDVSPLAERARALVRTLKQIVAEEVGRQAGELAARTRPNSSSLVILLRATAPFHKQKLPFGDGFGIEFLAKGQQVVIAGLHKTGAMQSSTLARHTIQELPELSDAVFSAIWARFRDAITRAGYDFASASHAMPAGAQSTKPSTEAAIVWREVMRRRTDWVPDLLPCSAQMPKGEWRFSSVELDRDLEEDLVIYPEGIYDFGTERPHGPRSLIQEFGSIDDQGAITFGGCPEYGPSAPYAVVGEGGSTVRRPSEDEATAWLYRVLGRPEDAPSSDPTEQDFARVLGLDWDCLAREVLLGKFDHLDEQGRVVELMPPDQWDPRTIKTNVRRLPAMRAADPIGFERLCDTWDRNFAATPDEIRGLIDAEVERVRNALPDQPADTIADQLSEAREGGSWSEPADIFGDDAQVAPADFPTHTLPPLLEAWAVSEARRKGVSTGFSATAALAAICAAVGASLRIKARQLDDWLEPSGLWVVLVAEPGSGKSPVISAALAPLRDLDRRHSSEDRKKHAEWQRLTKRAARKADTTVVSSEPIVRRYVIDDVTAESFIRIVADNPRGLMRASDEWASIMGAIGAYKRQGDGDRGMMLQTFDGRSISVDRVGSGNLRADSALQSILAGSQPEKIRKTLTDLSADGMAQRTLFVMSDDKRRVGLDETPNAAAQAQYRTVIQGLASAEYFYDEPIVLTPEGYAACRQAQEQISLIGRYPGSPAALRGHLEKWEKILFRIILALHAFEEFAARGCAATGLPVPLERVHRCIEIARFFIRHQVAFYDRFFGPDQAASEARWIAGHLLTKPELARVTHRNLYDARKALVGSDDRMRRQRVAIMQELVDAGWCSVESWKDGTPDSWSINPGIHSRFADRAERERQQRASRQLEIAEAGRARRGWLNPDSLSQSEGKR